MAATEHDTAHVVNVALNFEVTEKTLRSVLTTALEGGIGYWSMASDIKRDEDGMIYSVRLEPATNRGLKADEFPAETVTTRGQVLSGIVRVAQGGMANQRITENVRRILTEGDEADFDVDDADSIIQAGMWAEVTYG